jgi:hypothetical protein
MVLTIGVDLVTVRVRVRVRDRARVRVRVRFRVRVRGRCRGRDRGWGWVGGRDRRSAWTILKKIGLRCGVYSIALISITNSESVQDLLGLGLGIRVGARDQG